MAKRVSDPTPVPMTLNQLMASSACSGGGAMCSVAWEGSWLIGSRSWLHVAECVFEEWVADGDRARRAEQPERRRHRDAPDADEGGEVRPVQAQPVDVGGRHHHPVEVDVVDDEHPRREGGQRG